MYSCIEFDRKLESKWSTEHMALAAGCEFFVNLKNKEPFLLNDRKQFYFSNLCCVSHWFNSFFL